jgi:fructosamine-3-kinase
MWDVIEASIRAWTGSPFTLSDCSWGSGGSINQAYCIGDGRQTYFIKLNQAHKASMFEAEALGLQAMAVSQSIFVPKAVCWGIASTSSYIVLEWVDLGQGNVAAWVEMGRQLAYLHRQISTQGFGWQQNNTIGDTPQLNPWTEDWVTFFTTHRIAYQLQLAQRNGGHFGQAEELLYAIPTLLADHAPQPSLVHGDLWSGNAAFDLNGNPVIFDPAVYYGDREVDLAMSELFGGFPAAFYQGYQMAWPLDPGYAQRKVLYNLYHILNHFNLFGGSYERQAQRMMKEILSML